MEPELKTLKEARIEVVKSNQLREGDKILWSNLICEVIMVSHSGVVRFKSTPEAAIIEEQHWMFWYRIIEVIK